MDFIRIINNTKVVNDGYTNRSMPMAEPSAGGKRNRGPTWYPFQGYFVYSHNTYYVK
jgi:hypothetical protein